MPAFCIQCIPCGIEMSLHDNQLGGVSSCWPTSAPQADELTFYCRWQFKEGSAFAAEPDLALAEAFWAHWVGTAAG
jgi:hypothetical protein